MVLRTLQREFVRNVFEAGEIATDLIRGHGASPADRLAVYRNNAYNNYRDALADVYPVVAKLVGEHFFGFAARRFIPAHRSRSGDLGAYGAEFAAFLKALPEARGLPYLFDIARLEWAWNVVFHARSAEPLALQRLAALSAEEQSALRFTLNPAVRLIASDYPILRIWEICQDGYDGDQHVDLDMAGDELVLMQEPDFSITIERLTRGDHALLAACSNGATVAGALGAEIDGDANFDFAKALHVQIDRGRMPI
ncbi:MAG: putative DNA-binding domain-containing protein [Burkholderiales bacterium]